MVNAFDGFPEVVQTLIRSDLLELAAPAASSVADLRMGAAAQMAAEKKLGSPLVAAVTKQIEVVSQQNAEMIQLVAAMEQQIASLSKLRARHAATVRQSVAGPSEQVHARSACTHPG